MFYYMIAHDQVVAVCAISQIRKHIFDGRLIRDIDVALGNRFVVEINTVEISVPSTLEKTQESPTGTANVQNIRILSGR